MELHDSLAKILLPVDISAHSREAVHFTAFLMSYLREKMPEITLVHILAEGYLSRRTGYIDFRVEELKQSDVFKKLKQRYLEEKILPFLNEGERILTSAGIEKGIQKMVLEGDVAHEITRIADEGRYSLIIMARRGLSEVKKIFLGSITAKVIGNAPCDVLVIPPDGKRKISNILIATDGSQYSNAAALHAIAFAKTCSANVTVISVVPSESATPLDIVQSEMQRELISEKELKEAEKNVHSIKELATKEGLHVSGIIVAGKPYEAIIDTARNLGTDLIVIGSHGKTGLEKIFMGSVAERVIILSSCAVLVTRIPKDM